LILRDAGPGLPATPPRPEEVSLELERILGSESFRNKPKLARFLRYVVEASLASESSAIKQYSVGEALGYGSAVDSDNNVRAHAVRLRQALSAYYAGPGIDDAVRVELPKGRYVPVFSSHRSVPPLPSTKRPGFSFATRFRVGAGLTVAAALVAGALISWRWRQPAAAGDPRLTSITVADALNDSPSTSADGRLIAFSSDAEGNGDISRGYPLLAPSSTPLGTAMTFIPPRFLS